MLGELERELIQAIKDNHVQYCKSKRRFTVPTEAHMEELPPVITKRCVTCELVTCLRQPVCRIIELTEAMKEDFLEFYQRWQQLVSIEEKLRRVT